MIIGERIKESRLNKNMTQDELGKILGVSKVSICGYEKGARTPNMDNFLDLVKALDLDIKYVLGQDLKALKEDNEEYGVHVSTVDMEIIDAIKKSRELYNTFCANPQKTVEQIKNKLNI